MFMIQSLQGVLLSSENTTKLADFYKDVVGLKTTAEYEMGEDGVMGYAFEEVQLFINPHDKVKGKNKNPERLMLNFEVTDCEKEFNRLKKKGVKVIQEIYHIEGYGLVCTFEDVDGNYFQFVQIRAAN